MENQNKLSHDDYTVAWICPLEVEQVAALEMLDEEHQRLPQREYDHNAYNLGSIYGHNVVIAGLPTTGNCSAATVVAQMRNTYPRLRFGLLVGIGGGVPLRTKEGPIRLGHIVVSEPVGQHSGAVQYDHGKAEAGEFVRTGYLAPPPTVLLNAARELQVRRRRLSDDPLVSHLRRIDTSRPGLRSYKQPWPDQDQLYESDYVHLDKEKSCRRCVCDASKLVDRNAEDSDDDDSTNCANDDRLVVHRGTIASGETVMRNGRQRDTLARTQKVLCFEMEAAGAMNDFPCLVVRGISDYSDSHKNDKWHGYAAAVAAAYARELFRHMPADEVKQCKIAETDVESLIQNTRETTDFILDSRVKDWLKPSDASDNLDNACQLRHSNTGCWFLESEHYKWLKNNSGARLWLQGFLGCGKTVLASTIIEDLTTDSHLKGAVIYFFFTFGDGSKQSLGHMLRSLIHQLTRLHNSTKTPLIELYESCGKGNKQPKTEELIEVFDQMVSGLGEVTVVLDALDEMETPYYQHFGQRVAHAAITRIFLAYLWTTAKTSEATRTAVLSFPLIELAAQHWMVHATIAGEEEKPTFDWTRKILTSSRFLRYWAPICAYDGDYDAFPGLYYASRFALHRSVEYLLSQGADPNAQEGEYRNALQAASISGNVHITQMLLDHGASVNAKGGPHGSALHAAVWYGHVDTVLLLLEYGAGIGALKWGRKWRRRRAVTALHVAAYKGHTEIVEALLKRGADVNAPNLHATTRHDNIRSHYTALEAASFAGHVQVVKVLLSNNPDVDARAPCSSSKGTTRGEHSHPKGYRYGTPLRAASMMGHLNIVRILMESGAQVNIKSGPGSSALHVALWQGYTELSLFLIESGADIHARGSFHETTLDAAIRGGDLAMVQLLVEHGVDIDQFDRSGESPLICACKKESVQMIELLLDNGADINAKGGKFSTALYAAISYNDLELVRMLLDRGASVNVQAGKFNDALQTSCALFCENHGLVRLLLDHGADVNAIGGEYGTALCAATIKSDVEKMQLLLDSGAEVNARGGRYGTALCAASWIGNVELVRLLLDSGAKVNAPGGEYCTALYAAYERGHETTMRLLLDKGVDPNAHHQGYDNLLYTASYDEHLAVAKMLLLHGADPNIQGGELGTALAAASYKGSIDLVQTLLDNDASVNSQSGWYGNALQSSCCPRSYVRDPDMIQFLLDKGASINAQGGNYGTALCAASSKGELEIVRLLLREGADVNAPGGTYYYRVLCAAAYKDHIDVVRVLMEKGAVAGLPTNPYQFALQDATKKGNKDVIELLIERGALGKLTRNRANPYPGLKRSASDPCFYSFTDNQPMQEDATCGSPKSSRRSIFSDSSYSTDDSDM